jgi:hypothetical protein
MNIISLASDLSKILKEQISILNSIVSLKGSLKKLVAQKELPEKWGNSELVHRPLHLFNEAINSKYELIRTELTLLR